MRKLPLSILGLQDLPWPTGVLLLLGIYLTYRFAVAVIKAATKAATQRDELIDRFNKVDVRMGDIGALARIASKSDKHHWAVVEKLTAFVCEKSRRNKKAIDAFKKGEGVLHDLHPDIDVQDALTVICSRAQRDEPRLNLSKSILAGANLFYGHLEGADLRGAHLEEADLGGAHLEGANLYYAHLEGANLRGAHLKEADLGGAHLEGAHLEGARLATCKNLTWNQLAKVYLDEKTTLPPMLQKLYRARSARFYREQ